MKKCLFFLILIQITFASAQVFTLPGEIRYNPDSVRAEIDKEPYFSLFKDNYFAGGIPIDTRPNSYNSNVKFQLSIRQKITKSKLPFDSYLFIQFTQKTIWNVFQKSLPMYDLNFNPGIGFGRLIIRKNKYVGKAYLMIEHESNGKDSIFSRSWNRITFASSLLISRDIEWQFKTWIPIIDSDNNRDIQRYYGFMQTAFNFRSRNRRFLCSVLLSKRATSNLSCNTQLEFSYKFNENENQYIFLQYYNGYGENLFDYNKYKNILRVGFVIKPKDFSIF